MSFSLFLDAFPLDPRCPLNSDTLYVAINIYNMCKGRLGSRGQRGCTIQRIHHTSDKKIDYFARWCFLLYINCINIEIASTVDDQNKFSLKTKGFIR